MSSCARCSAKALAEVSKCADDLEFYVVEHWASAEALAARERTEAFINFGQGALAKHATLHGAVSGRPFV
jgi:quinol monooxygenase YgiN